MPRITADANAPTSRAISRPGMIKARAVPRTIALAVADNAAAVARPARRNVCLLSRFGRVVIVGGRVFLGGRLFVGGLLLRVFVFESGLDCALAFGKREPRPALHALLTGRCVH